MADTCEKCGARGAPITYGPFKGSPNEVDYCAHCSQDLCDRLDEATTRDEWRARPMAGDLVEQTDGPPLRGTVAETFYCNGEGGMHVIFGHGGSWASCKRVRVVTRWYLRGIDVL